MLKFKLSPLVDVMLALSAGAALAQTQPSAPPVSPPAADQQVPTPSKDKDQPAAVADVVVTARANEVRTSIDAVSYSLADDLQAATGATAAS